MHEHRQYDAPPESEKTPIYLPSVNPPESATSIAPGGRTEAVPQFTSDDCQGGDTPECSDPPSSELNRVSIKSV
jgi:hypothetical protein